VAPGLAEAEAEALFCCRPLGERSDEGYWYFWDKDVFCRLPLPFRRSRYWLLEESRSWNRGS
jgi:hypothetical protein